jgi:outer membrane protein assembly factor BamB
MPKTVPSFKQSGPASGHTRIPRLHVGRIVGTLIFLVAIGAAAPPADATGDEIIWRRETWTPWQDSVAYVDARSAAVGALPDGRIVAVSGGDSGIVRTLTLAPSGMRKPGQFGWTTGHSVLAPRQLLATGNDRLLMLARLTGNTDATSWPNFLVMLDGSGGLVWQRQMTDSEGAAVILDDGTVLIGTLGDMMRVRSQDGAPLWMESIVENVPGIGPASAVWISAGDGNAVQLVGYEPPGMIDSRRHAMAARALDDGRLAWSTVLEIGVDARLACATIHAGEAWSIWSASDAPNGSTLRWERRRIRDGAQIATGTLALPPLDDPVCGLGVIGNALILQIDTDVDASWVLAMGDNGVELWRDGGPGFRQARATALPGSSDMLTSMRPSAAPGIVEHARRDAATGTIRWRTAHPLPSGFTSALTTSSSRILTASLSTDGVASIRMDGRTGSLIESTTDAFRRSVALPSAVLTTSKGVYEVRPSNGGPEGEVLLSEIDPLDGRIVRQTSIPSVRRPGSPWLVSLIATGNDTLALIVNYPSVSPGTSNNCYWWRTAIIGVDVQEGRVLWRRDIADMAYLPFVQAITGLGLRVDYFPAVAPTCGTALSRGEILDVRSGDIRWNGMANDWIQAALHGDLLRYSETASGARAWIRERLQPRTELWRSEADSWTPFGIAHSSAIEFTNVDLLSATNQARMRAQRRAAGNGSVIATRDIFDPEDPIESPDFSAHADGYAVATARRLRSISNSAPTRSPVITRWNPRTLGIDWQTRPELQRGVWWTMRLPVAESTITSSGDLLLRSVRYGRYYGSASMDASIAVATLDRADGRVLFEQLAERAFDLPLTAPQDWTPRVRLDDGSLLATGTRTRIDGITVPYVERRAPPAVRGARLRVSADDPASPVPGREQARQLEVRVENHGPTALEGLDVVITPIRELGHVELMLRECVLTGEGSCPPPISPNSPPASLSLAPGAAMILLYEVRLHGWQPTIRFPDRYGAVLRVDPPYSIGVTDLSETVVRVRIR